MKHINAMEQMLTSVERNIQKKINCHFKEANELLKTIPPVKDGASVIGIRKLEDVNLLLLCLKADHPYCCLSGKGGIIQR